MSESHPCLSVQKAIMIYVVSLLIGVLFFVIFKYGPVVQAWYQGRTAPYTISEVVQRDIGSFAVSLEEEIRVPLPASFDRGEQVDNRDDGLRMAVIAELMDHGFSGFSAHPLGDADAGVLTLSGGMLVTDFDNNVDNDIVTQEDALDIYIREWREIVTESDELIIPSTVRRNRSDIALFRNQEQFDSLDYDLVSWRERINTDPEYRRKNLLTAFATRGHIRVVNPGESVSFMRNVGFDPRSRRNYQYGFGIKGTEVVRMYAGGICGASTALYQGIMTHPDVTLVEGRAHTKRYTDLYTALINGQEISTPGLDMTVYGFDVDVVFRNDGAEPLIVVMAYDGEYQSPEQVFTLSRPVVNRPFEYIRRYRNQYYQWCYEWEIDGETRVSCYNDVK